MLSACDSTDMALRASAFVGLELWVRTVSGLSASSGAGRGDVASKLAPPDLLTRLNEAVVLNWDLPVKAVSCRMPSLFEALLDLQDTLASVASRDALVELLLGYNKASRARYAALQALVPRVSAQALLDARPGLITSLMRSVCNITAGGHAARLLLAILVNLRQDMERRAGFAAGSMAHVEYLGTPPSLCTPAAAASGPAADAQSKRKAKAKAKKKASSTSKEEQTVYRMAALRAVESPGDVDGADAQYWAVVAAWRAVWMPALARWLLHPVHRYRLRIAQVAFRTLIGADPAFVVPFLEVLDAVQCPTADAPDDGMQWSDRKMWAALWAIRAALRFRLFDPRHLLGRAGDAGRPAWLSVTHDTLRRGVVHADDDLRVLALAVATSQVAEPCDAELELVRCALHCAMKAHVEIVRRDSMVEITRFLLRLREHSRETLRKLRYHVSKRNSDGSAADDGDDVRQLRNTANRIAGFIQWCTTSCLGGMYPGAPFDRVVSCMDLLKAVVDTWRDTAAASANAVVKSSSVGAGANSTAHPRTADADTPPAPVHDADVFALSHPLDHMLRPETSLLLMNNLITTWDRMRSTARVLIDLLPAPLPGMATPAAVRHLLWSALHMSSSPRVRECDAGATVMRVLFAKYVKTLGWRVTLGRTIAAVEVQAPSSDGDAAAFADVPMVFVRSLVGVLRARRVAMEAVIDTACAAAGAASAAAGSSSDDGAVSDSISSDLPLVHGALMVLRQVLQELDLRRNVQAWRGVVRGMIDEILLAYRAAMRIIADRAEGDGGVLGGDDHSAQPVTLSAPGDATTPVRVDCRGHIIHRERAPGSTAVDDGRSTSDHNDSTTTPAATSPYQFIIVATWTVVKESTLLLASLLDAVQLPAGTAPDASHDAASTGSEPALASWEDAPDDPWVISTADTARIGFEFFRALLLLKHPGAIAHTVKAFQSVCHGLLSHGARHPALAALPGVWLDSLLARVADADAQFILRRSAGFGKAFMAIVKAEPGGRDQGALLHRAVTSLLRYADAPLDDMDVPWRTRVHALNTLRNLFSNSDTGTRVVPFCGQAMRSAVAGFRATSWAVRNSSMMLFSAVTNRLTEMENTRNVEASRVFLAHKSLHGYLLDQLQVATTLSLHPEAEVEAAVGAGAGAGAGASAGAGAPPVQTLHPSMFPVLLFLSLLRAPKEPTRGMMATMSVDAFAPLLMQCSGLRHAMARVVAAKALASLSSPWQLGARVVAVLSPLPTDASRLVKTPPLNQLHGVLLQARALMDAMEAMLIPHQPPPLSPSTLSPVDEKSGARSTPAPDLALQPMLLAALQDVGPALTSRTWTTSAAVVPCGRVREVAFAALAAYQRCVRWAAAHAPATTAADGTPVAWHCPVDVAALALARLDAAAAAAAAGAPARVPDPGLDMELDTGARLAMHGLLGPAGLAYSLDAATVEHAHTAVRDVLAHPVEAVRVAAAEATLNATVARLADGVSGGGEDGGSADVAPAVAATCAWLAAQLPHRLEAETHPAAIRHLTALLRRLCDVPRCVPYTAATWALVLKLHAANRSMATLAHLLTVLGELLGGACVDGPAGADDGAAKFSDLVRQFTAALLHAFTLTGEYDVRIAALHAVRRSGVLLLVAPSAAAPAAEPLPATTRAGVFQLWANCLELVQDGDDQVRDAARQTLSVDHAAEQPELTLRRALQWLTTHCAGDSSYHAWLLAAVHRHGARAKAAVDDAVAAATAQHSDRPVFDGDAEIDGYTEPTVFVDAVVRQIAALADGQPALAAQVVQFAAPLARDALRAVCAAAKHEADGGAAVASGGVGFGGPLYVHDVYVSLMCVVGCCAAVRANDCVALKEAASASASLLTAAGTVVPAPLERQLRQLAPQAAGAQSAIIVHPHFPLGVLSAIVPRLRRVVDVVVGTTAFTLHQEDISKDVGLTTWPSGIFLANHLFASAQDAVRGRAVLELGCGGSPLATMTAALCGARSAWATDGSDGPLDLARRNVDANVGLPARAAITMARLRWGHVGDTAALRRLLRNDVAGATDGCVDTIVAADVIYHQTALLPLADALVQFSRPGTVSLVCYQVRLHDFEREFFETLLPSRGFTVSAVAEDTVKTMRVRVMKCVKV